MVGNLSRALIPAVLAIAAFWTAAGVAKKTATQNSSSNWPTVDGVVIESQVKPGGTSENIVHDFAFRCVYQTIDGTFELDRMTRFGRIGTYFRGGPAELAAAYMPGDVVNVHYNPMNHSEAVLGTGLTRGELFSAGAIILALVAVGIAGTLGAADPLMGSMVSYRPMIKTSTGQFNRSPVEAKPMEYSRI